MYPDHMWWGGMWMMFPSLFFLILLILVPLLLWQKGCPFGNSKDNPETPLDILKKRYAKGEISKEEFEEMKKTIS